MRHSRVLLSLGLLLCLGANSRAAVLVVTDTADTTNLHSLRGAIIFANRIGGRNTIVLQGPSRHAKNSPAIFHLTIPGSNEDSAQTGDLDITKGNLTILGSSRNIVIDASELGDRAFQVFPRASLTLFNVTITGGAAPSSGFSSEATANGGAIFNGGTLTAESCIFTNNTSGAGISVEGNGGGSSGGSGGAIYNLGKALLIGCLIDENATGDGVDGAFGGVGGGLANDGTCTLLSCFIVSNRTGAGGPPAGNFGDLGGEGGDGGGLFNSGTMKLTKCIVAQNLTGFGGGAVGGGGAGGGIYNFGRLSVNDSSIFDNTTGNGGDGGISVSSSSPVGGFAGFGGSGGGIFNLGKLDLNTSTISRNLCGNGGEGGSILGGGANGGNGGNGAGLWNSGTSVLTSCTIVLNTTGNGGGGGSGSSFVGLNNIADGGGGGAGGGIFNLVTNSITLRNTLIGLNAVGSGGQAGTTVYVSTLPDSPTNEFGMVGLNGFGSDVFGTFTSGGFNLVGVLDEGAATISGGNADLIGGTLSPIDPLIGPLQANGGPTPTHALLPGSPAIDQGNSFKIHKDQRGVRRPFNDSSIANSTGGDGTDIGAFEVSSARHQN